MLMLRTKIFCLFACLAPIEALSQETNDSQPSTPNSQRLEPTPISHAPLTFFAGSMLLMDAEVGASWRLLPLWAIEASARTTIGETTIVGTLYTWREASVRGIFQPGGSFFVSAGPSIRHKTLSFKTSDLTNVYIGNDQPAYVTRTETTLTAGGELGIGNAWHIEDALFGKTLVISVEWLNLYKPYATLTAKSSGPTPSGISSEVRKVADDKLKSRAKLNDVDIMRARLGISLAL